MEELRRFEKQLGFRLVYIDSKGMLRKTLEIMGEKGVRSPTLIDSRQYSRNILDVMYTPTTVIVDVEGRMRSRLVGHSDDFEDVVRDILERIRPGETGDGPAGRAVTVR